MSTHFTARLAFMLCGSAGSLLSLKCRRIDGKEGKPRAPAQGSLSVSPEPLVGLEGGTLWGREVGEGLPLWLLHPASLPSYPTQPLLCLPAWTHSADGAGDCQSPENSLSTTGFHPFLPSPKSLSSLINPSPQTLLPPVP